LVTSASLPAVDNPVCAEKKKIIDVSQFQRLVGVFHKINCWQ